MSTILLENCIHWNSTKILFKYRFSNMNVNLYQVALQRSWTSFFTFLYFTISKIHWFRSKFVRDIHVYDNCMLLYAPNALSAMNVTFFQLHDTGIMYFPSNVPCYLQPFHMGMSTRLSVVFFFSKPCFLVTP